MEETCFGERYLIDQKVFSKSTINLRLLQGHRDKLFALAVYRDGLETSSYRCVLCAFSFLNPALTISFRASFVVKNSEIGVIAAKRTLPL
jgi:hypothetical protein